MSYPMTDIHIDADAVRMNCERSSAATNTVGSDIGPGPDSRSLSYEEIIERARADRAAMIQAFLRTVAGSMKSLLRARSPQADALTRAHARSEGEVT